MRVAEGVAVVVEVALGVGEGEMARERLVLEDMTKTNKIAKSQTWEIRFLDF